MPETDASSRHAEAATALDGRVAIITGGTAGIGLAAARALRARGARVVVVSRSDARLRDAERTLAGAGDADGVAAYALDVTRPGDNETMVERALERFGRIDLLVAAAGVLRPTGEVHTLAQTSLSEWEAIIDLNLTGTYLSNRAVLPTMLGQRSGQIINVSSTSGRRGYAYDAAYCASKFAVIGMTEALAAEVAPRGVRVNVLLPGAIETQMWDQNGPIPKPESVLPVDEVGELVAMLACMPTDAVCVEATIEPMRRQPPPRWRGGGAATP